MSTKTLSRRNSLFRRIFITIGGVSILFQLFTLAIISYLTLVPLGKRSADDLVTIMQDSAQQWHQAGESEASAFAENLWQDHSIRITNDSSPHQYTNSLLPYLWFVETSLHRLIGPDTRLLTSHDDHGNAWYWADIMVDGETVRVGFPEFRIGVHPPFALFIVLSVGGIVILLTTVLLARWISRPIEDISSAAQLIGTGVWPEPLPEQGVRELSSLATSFNAMSQKIQQLLEHRTTMLTGISHDLRTPLARMQLALAMLPEEMDAELRNSLERDLNEMNSLIGQFLDVGRALGENQLEQTDIREALQGLADDAVRGGAIVEFIDSGPCRSKVNRLALCRIISNLLDNALRYGASEPIRIDYTCGANGLTIHVSDRGPGIPENMRETVFQPFFRLEKSRNSRTGGSGLGLAIARQLAEANGWEVKLMPRESRGTVAEVHLPRALKRLSH
ncbi:MAG: ATP-binding protein [Gammaproteobacteria bacterium]|nr:ATP-binding protein [Gammaproteobacteria bacterium]